MSRSLSNRFALTLVLLLASACHHQKGQDDGGAGDDMSVGADMTLDIVISPQNPVIVVGPNSMVHTQAFTAKLGGQPVSVTWSTDREELGNFADPTMGAYTTVGNFGGKGTITAKLNGLVATTSVTIDFVDTGNNGDPADPNCTYSTAKDNVIGKGGYAGVGGDGPGCPASATQQTTLGGTATTDATVTLLYPYDKTVWPKGQLAPLLMWNPSTHKFDSMRLQMQSKSGTYTYDGTFATPHSANATVGFINVPIPQSTWQTMNESSAGDQVTITVTLGEGATAYGPFVEKWVIATGVLTGTVYYNSYGTGVGTAAAPNVPLQNSGDKDANGNLFAGAVLGIQPGRTDPVLIAGHTSSSPNAKNSDGSPASASQDGCRVCHTVSRDGSRLITQNGSDYDQSILFDLKAPDPSTTETTFMLPNPVPDGDAVANSAFSAIYPDGKGLFTHSLPPPGPGDIQGDDWSRAYTLPDGITTLTTAHFPSGFDQKDFHAAFPSFAADGSQVVFNWYGGAGSDQKSIATMTFDESTNTYGAVTKLLTPANGLPAVWPSFLPGQTGVLFELETVTKEFGYTRNGVRAHLEWVDTKTQTEFSLDQLNGVGYLPSADLHTSDQELNYEPTVNPVASGGYAWVVFTSRRLYGNVATQDPDLSDPRQYDWTHNITTKKLWVAAIDLNAQAGADPSHPAFYLPGQELFAGNMRGFWTVDPCKGDGTSCVTGDECCGGFCATSTTADGGASGFYCSAINSGCAGLNDKCTSDTDCCQPTQTSVDDPQPANTCINGYCSQSTPITIQ